MLTGSKQLWERRFNRFLDWSVQCPFGKAELKNLHFLNSLATGPLDMICILSDALSQYLKDGRQAEVIFLWLVGDKQWADSQFQCHVASFVDMRSLQPWQWEEKQQQQILDIHIKAATGWLSNQRCRSSFLNSTPPGLATTRKHLIL